MSIVAMCPFCMHQTALRPHLDGTRARCRKCSNIYSLIPLEPRPVLGSDETIDDSIPSARRMALRRVVHVHCPSCECGLHLTRTKWVRITEAELAKLEITLRTEPYPEVELAELPADGVETISASVATETEVSPGRPIALPSRKRSRRRSRRRKRKLQAVARAAAPSESIGTLESGPSESRPLELPPPATPEPVHRPVPRRQPAEPGDREPFLPLAWFVPCVIILVSAAMACTTFSRLAVAVLPLSVLGFLGGIAALSAAIRGKEFVARSAAAAGYGTLVLLAVIFTPSLFGEKYYAYRQPLPNADVVQVIPKSGQPVTGIPKDPDWVDATKFGLQRNQVLVEILNATVGRVEVRAKSGALSTSTEPYLVMQMRRQSIGNVESMASDARKFRPESDSELTLKLTDDQGREYARQDINMDWNSSGVAQRSGGFPVSTTGDVIAFSAPPADVQWLHLEVSSQRIGPKPLRFTIPKSMIVRR